MRVKRKMASTSVRRQTRAKRLAKTGRHTRITVGQTLLDIVAYGRLTKRRAGRIGNVLKWIASGPDGRLPEDGVGVANVARPCFGLIVPVARVDELPKDGRIGTLHHVESVELVDEFVVIVRSVDDTGAILESVEVAEVLPRVMPIRHFGVDLTKG